MALLDISSPRLRDLSASAADLAPRLQRRFEGSPCQAAATVVLQKRGPDRLERGDASMGVECT
jgi:hypothetical protein